MHHTEHAISPLIEPDEDGWLHRAIRRVRTTSRRKRAALFHRYFDIRPDTRILDLGGSDGTHIHYLLADSAASSANVHVADIDHAAVERAVARYRYQPVFLAENAGLPFPDRYFDVVVCSSVLEHVTIPKQEIWQERSDSRFRQRACDEQRRFAIELARVTHGYFVQVPYRGFPVETHSWLPFVGIVPRPLQCRIIALANRCWIKRTIPDFHLPGVREMSGYFPSARLVRERWLGLTKSLIAIKPDPRARGTGAAA
ncbi:MAG: methyltransferase domain-containing protein [Steroidobacteraceae bacterium]